MVSTLSAGEYKAMADKYAMESKVDYLMAKLRSTAYKPRSEETLWTTPGIGTASTAVATTGSDIQQLADRTARMEKFVTTMFHALSPAQRKKFFANYKD